MELNCAEMIAPTAAIAIRLATRAIALFTPEAIPALDSSASDRTAAVSGATTIAGARPRRLAEAIEAEHSYGPKVAAAVDRSHEAMGRLQKETLSHIFAMRQLLRPDQAARFDAAVTKALTDEGR